jgi:hypothetical protein
LVIFTVKSLITTAIFGGVGVIFFLLFSALQMRLVGIIILLLLALIGFGFGTIKIPRITGWQFTKNIEGDSMDEVFLRYIKFRNNKKVYSYTKEDN